MSTNSITGPVTFLIKRNPDESFSEVGVTVPDDSSTGVPASNNSSMLESIADRILGALRADGDGAVTDDEAVATAKDEGLAGLNEIPEGEHLGAGDVDAEVVRY